MLMNNVAETMMFGDKNTLRVQRPTHIQYDSSEQEGLPDVEMEDANELTTSRQRYFRPNPEDLEVGPYETPVVLKNRKRRVIELSDTESDTSKKLQIDRDGRESGKNNKESVTKVCCCCCVVMRLNW
jgi:hypothetical protein